MHELHAAKKIRDVLNEQAAISKTEKILRVKLRIGRLSNISPESISLYMRELSKGTVFEDAAFEFEETDSDELSLMSFEGE